MNPAQLINSSTAPLEERSRAPSSLAEDLGDDSHGGAGISSYACALRLRDDLLAEWCAIRLMTPKGCPTPMRLLTSALTDEVFVMVRAYSDGSFWRPPVPHNAQERPTDRSAVEVRLS
jgi:hypothetical protein